MDDEGRAAVEFLFEASNGGPVLELGVGTGKLAIPLAERASESTASTRHPRWWTSSGASRGASA